jgi:hypothetical protein
MASSYPRTNSMMEQRTNASSSVSHVHNRHGLRAILPAGWRRSDFCRPRVALAAIPFGRLRSRLLTAVRSSSPFLTGACPRLTYEMLVSYSCVTRSFPSSIICSGHLKIAKTQKIRSSNCEGAGMVDQSIQHMTSFGDREDRRDLQDLRLEGNPSWPIHF